MAKASRKQPDFDPNELSDLIFSPAVGNGVGSHLIGSDAVVTTVVGTEPSIVVNSSSVDMSPQATVAVPQRTTVDGLPAFALLERASLDAHGATTLPPRQMTTVDASENLDQSTVAILEVATAISPTSAPLHTSDQSTVAVPQRTTVDKSRSVALFAAVWFTETGEVVSKARVKPVRDALDVINPAEQAVYRILWNSSQESADSRLAQAGYHHLVQRTGFSKRTIQRIISRLTDKDFIAIEQPADIYQRTSTVYRVFSTQSVLQRHTEKGRLHVAKLGPGYSYVKAIPWNGP